MGQNLKWATVHINLPDRLDLSPKCVLKSRKGSWNLWRAVCSLVAGRPTCCFLLPRGSRRRSAWPCRTQRRPRWTDPDQRGPGRNWTGCCCALSAARSAPGWWSVSGSGWGRSWRWACRGWTEEPCRTAPVDERCPAPRNRRTPDVDGKERHHWWRN